jgi:hypothetical protein
MSDCEVNALNTVCDVIYDYIGIKTNIHFRIDLQQGVETAPPWTRQWGIPYDSLWHDMIT